MFMTIRLKLRIYDSFSLNKSNFSEFSRIVTRTSFHSTVWSAEEAILVKYGKNSFFLSDSTHLIMKANEQQLILSLHLNFSRRGAHK